MRIGELSGAGRVPPETIRFYEKRGLLPLPRRTANGYREYEDADLAQLRFIRTAQAAGLTLSEIGSILELRTDGTVPCAHVEALLADKLDEIRDRQRQLAELERDLENLLQRSAELDPADCGPADICQILTGGTAGV